MIQLFTVFEKVHRTGASAGASDEADYRIGESTGASDEAGHRAGASAGASDEAGHPSASSAGALEADYRAGASAGGSDEVDEIEELEERIVELAAHLNAGNHRLLLLIARFDRKRGWEPAGYRSCAHWLAFHTGVDMGTAREQVRVARSLTELPQTGAAMARGELSFSAAQELTRVATRESEAELIEYARSCTVAELRRLIRSWRRLGREDELERERLLHASRRFAVVADGEGMYVVRGRLTPEVGAVLMRAVEAASDALFRAEDGVEPEQRRADALGLLAERALAAGFGGTVDDEEEEGAELVDGARGEEAEGATPSEDRARAGGDRDANAAAAAEVTTKRDGEGVFTSFGEAGLDRSGAGPSDGIGRSKGTAPSAASARSAVSGSSAAAPPAAPAGSDTAARTAGPSCCGHARRIPLSGSRAERYQVVIHVEPEALKEDGAGGRSELEDGTRLSAETARRFACDASVVSMLRGPDGSVLDVGRKTRTIPPALRRALEVRDRGCRFPGCGLRFTEAHHIVHWADGGETSLANTVLTCAYHHRLLHEEGFSLRVLRGKYVFFDRDGMPVPDTPPRLGGGTDPVGALLRENRRRGVEPTYRSCTPRYRRSDDIPLHVVLRAMEAATVGGREVRVGRRAEAAPGGSASAPARGQPAARPPRGAAT